MNEKLIEYDKRIGVPKFEGWQEREKEALCNCTWPSCNKLRNCRNK